MITTSPPNNAHFSAIRAKTFVVTRFYRVCAHFSAHALYVLLLNLLLPTHSFKSGVSAVAKVTIPQKNQALLFLHKNARTNNLCALLIFLKQFTIKLATHLQKRFGGICRCYGN